MKTHTLVALGLFAISASAFAEEVDLTSAPVTALSCALEAKKTGRLEVLTNCPMAEARKGYVVFDVAEKQIYHVAPKNIYFYELESAFGGGSVDMTGEIVEKKNGIPVIEVAEYSVTPKPKAGAFKGCL